MLLRNGDHIVAGSTCLWTSSTSTPTQPRHCTHSCGSLTSPLSLLLHENLGRFFFFFGMLVIPEALPFVRVIALECLKVLDVVTELLPSVVDPMS